MRIFVGAVEVAGFNASLHRGLRELGVDVLLVDSIDDKRRYDPGPRSLWTRLLERVVRLERYRGLYRVGLAGRLMLLCWAALRCRAFVYSYFGTITPYPEREFRLLRSLGKRLVFVFHGSDSRPSYMESRLTFEGRTLTPDDLIEMAAARRKAAALAHRYGHAVVVNPFSAYFHESPSINIQALGNPYPPPADDAAAPPDRADGKVRILHAPSAPELKGTDRIRRAIATLQGRGRPIEYLELTGRTHAEVVRELQLCDFVVDQAYSDTPMALFATEAAAYGRPAVVGGYIGPHLGDYVRPEWLPPVAYCHPDELEDTIDRLASDPAARRRLGDAARQFVQRVRSPRAVAERVMRLVTDDVPDEWRFDPRELRYVNGLGDEAVIRHLIQLVVERGGVEALRLSHAPAVETRLLTFARIGTAGTVELR